MVSSSDWFGTVGTAVRIDRLNRNNSRPRAIYRVIDATAPETRPENLVGGLFAVRVESRDSTETERLAACVEADYDVPPESRFFVVPQGCEQLLGAWYLDLHVLLIVTFEEGWRRGCS